MCTRKNIGVPFQKKQKTPNSIKKLKSRLNDKLTVQTSENDLFAIKNASVAGNNKKEKKTAQEMIQKSDNETSCWLHIIIYAQRAAKKEKKTKSITFH